MTNRPGSITFDIKERRTKLSEQAQTDIMRIVRKHRETGELDHISSTLASYGDFTQVPDMQTALNQADAANDMFGELPAEIRKRFNHSPAEFVEFFDDPENDLEAIELGLKPDPNAPGPPPEEPPSVAPGEETPTE